MSLIKDMLENLEDRQAAHKIKKPETPPKERAMELPTLWKKPFVYTLGLSILILIAAVIYLVSYPSHLIKAKNYTVASLNHLQQTLTTTIKAHKTLSYQRHEQAVHQLYMQAMNEMNEGDVTIAMQKLKLLTANYPDFLPAKQAYEQLMAKRGINQ